MISSWLSTLRIGSQLQYQWTKSLLWLGNLFLSFTLMIYFIIIDGNEKFRIFELVEIQHNTQIAPVPVHYGFSA